MAYAVPVVPAHTEFEPDMVGDGSGFTVTVTLLLFAHPVKVTVSVKEYEVVTDGDTVGFAVKDVNPAGLDTHP